MNSVGVQRLYRLRLTECVVSCGRPLNSYRVHPSGASEDTVGTSCLPSVVMPANRALSRVYPPRGKRARSDGCWAPPLEVSSLRPFFLRVIQVRFAPLDSPQLLSGAYRGKKSLLCVEDNILQLLRGSACKKTACNTPSSACPKNMRATYTHLCVPIKKTPA